MNDVPRPAVEVHAWEQAGYQPLVFTPAWMIALLNWEPAMDLANAHEIERHVQTDEVFVLVRGQAALYTASPAGFELIELQPGRLYNVTAGTWHNLLATRQAAFVIIENRDTHLQDTELRPLEAAERQQLLSLAPQWSSIA
jgi:mannose-6-phosphate isomerase-like protein (cupin superfamily)